MAITAVYVELPSRVQNSEVTQARQSAYHKHVNISCRYSNGVKHKPQQHKSITEEKRMPKTTILPETLEFLGELE
ncbi:Hypothetical protein CINCED_3A009926 [Cinara cedri]|uniref:Uncharacterized protein n=1 Tax=Cinara cedri TaxID=506608 RepID=A0A5E4MVQ4_9HEMI|nr:Hypothetical protein CINCED_3A009926 [Cinara cedri]